ncbi:pectate lyase [Auriculariales sp. MPI-PUGE-AT-0066]|nr:pectate lyase [Auriculariales sp. MPI-PUGE-AT-0066]
MSVRDSAFKLSTVPRSAMRWYLLAAFIASTTALKVQITPAAFPVRQFEGYTVWQISDGTASNTSTFDGIRLTLKPIDDVFLGGRYRPVSDRDFPAGSYYGEFVVGVGQSSNTTTGSKTLSLSISGLSAGEHTLLAYHNAWDALSSVANIDVAVDGTIRQTNLAQSVRKDSIWNAATSFVTFDVGSPAEVTTVTWTPTGSGTGADARAYLNGFEVDVPAIQTQPSYPEPLLNDDHANADSGSIELQWRAAAGINVTSYAIYVSTVSAEDAQTAAAPYGASIESHVTLSDIDHFKTYWWRVDTITTSGATITGRVWKFRPRVLAFPGADGFGKYAIGGRGGKVLRVTSLDDYGSGTPINGTLRWAIEQYKYPRIIVFDVGGEIKLKSKLVPNDGFITIAGQTAPGKGVVVTIWTFGLSGARDIVFRHLRVRVGKDSGVTLDGMGMRGSNYAIFDRCSISWTIDEAFSSRDAYNITLQRTLISEPLNAANHSNYPEGTQHGYSASIGGDRGSFHHNLLAHAQGRSWSMAGGVDQTATFKGRLSIVNNVVYNFGTRVTDGGAHEVDFISNYYKPGPSSKRTYDLQATYEDNLPGTQQYHCSGNMMLGVFDANSTQVGPTNNGTGYACYAQTSFTPVPTYQYFFDDPFMPNSVEYQPATEAYKRVMSDVGAWPLDEHDTRIIRETLDGTYTYNGSYTGYAGIIDDPKDVGGLESWPETQKPSWDIDTDGDGVPDWWDASTGGGLGWNALDGYLNWLAEPHQFIAPGAEATIDLVSLFKGFADSLSFTVATDTGSVSVSDSTATFTGPTTAAVARLIVSATDSEGSEWLRPYGIAIICNLGLCS